MYQFFDKSYVLFAYGNSTFNGQNFTIRLLFYTKWLGLGGLNGLGRPTDIERAVTINTINATVQLYSGGAIYSNTSGVLNGRVFAVAEPAYTAYTNNGGHAGFLGLPTADDVVTGTHHKQTFQGGNLEWDNGGTPVVRLPVANVSLTPVSSGIIRLQLGDSFALHALILAANGAALTDRAVTWSTSNGRVATVQANGVDATIKAIGGGTAIVTATSEGKVSPSLTVSVTAPCCQIGEGAPTTFVSQAIQDAVTRNRLSILLPSPSPVRRLGLGYVQELYSTGTPSNRYVVAKSDRVATAYVVTGELLAAYEKLGGPAGPLGYPSSESASGRQTFENASALAGTPVWQVSGAILTKWMVLGYESGAAGLPIGAAASILASSANTANVQTFAKGVIVSATSGPGAGQTFFISGAILARFTALGGVTGTFGLPLSDEFVSDGRRHQNFEGGYIDIGSGESSATAHPADRRPALSASPNPVVAGSRLRLSVSGFPDNSSIRISVTGQTDFVVSTTNGAYTWEIFVPLAASSASVAVRAQDITGGISNGATAATTYSIKALSESKLALAKTQGDGQSGPPGALLSQRLRIAVRDETGNPVAGV
ncbi:MAG: hypothetical protein ABIZ80_11980, partial [Bryobacteraceae bacterium]